ncbi:MAG: ribonuclease T [Xanthomonadales bacterium]|nr:ribonuclease T [Xanthomonadales bacterium]
MVAMADSLRPTLATRFRGFLPVVVDVETGGFDWNRHALLEIAAVPIDLDADGKLVLGDTISAHLEPAPGMQIDPKSLEVTGAVARVGHKRNPFHPFSVFDTVTMAGLAYGQTVLARAVHAAGIDWDGAEAHSAVYDAEKTAALFCTIANAWPMLTPPKPELPPEQPSLLSAGDAT